jgi:parallel beta-helix repeat protein
MSNIHIKNLTATGDGSSDHIFSINNSVFSLENLSLSNAGEHGIWIGNSTGEFDNLTSSNNKEDGIAASQSRIEMRDSVISGNEGDGIELDQASSLELRSSTISSNEDEGIDVEGSSYLKVRDSTISNNDDKAIKIDEGSVLEVKDSTITGKSGKNAIAGFNKSIMIISEDDGSTVISTTNSDAIYLRNSHGEIREGVVVSATGTNWASGIELWGSSIRIEEGATVNGTQDGGSVVGHMYSTIEISHGSTVSLPVWCGNDNTTTVALMSSGSNYSSATIGNNCKTLRF